MKKIYVVIGLLLLLCFASFSFKNGMQVNPYNYHYLESLGILGKKEVLLLEHIRRSDLNRKDEVEQLQQEILSVRRVLKGMDFWLRYLESNMYKKLNGPLPVEWETEVFEKFEKPYKREGAGLTLAGMYLEEGDRNKDSLTHLITNSLDVLSAYQADSITKPLQSYHHFFLCNRLFLLNLAAIYTTGFECPDTEAIIPELLAMMEQTMVIYKLFNTSFTTTPLPPDYLDLYAAAVQFVRQQPVAASSFNHFLFIRDFVNPLFRRNQQLINQYHVSSRSYIDYTLNKTASSIFSKGLYNGQNPKGIFLRVDNERTLAEIYRIGKLLFYDPILSGNNLRSCNSCHNSESYFTETSLATPAAFNGTGHLSRNAPSLIDAKFNQLVMLDGKHISLQNQLKEVITNALEMGGNEKEILKKMMSVPVYRKAFLKFLELTPQETEITLDHVASAITFYYSKFSNYDAPFDDMMNKLTGVEPAVERGFNLFMSKAQCGTCHFVPQFNGVKPPYTGSEFEVLGVPADKNYRALSSDKGRYNLNPAPEMMNALRTGTLRNAEKTAPYMHNGVFSNLDEVVDFYDAGGGIGHGLKVANQTLSSDSLHLSKDEKRDLLAFMHSLNEDITFEKKPAALPVSSRAILNKRKVGGTY